VQSHKGKIKFVVASRMSPEKGCERVIDFCKKVKKKTDNFVIDYFGDTPCTEYKEEIMGKAKDLKEIIWHGSKANLTSEIDNATYLLVLSDTEGCPYSMMEALQLRTPVISTDFPSAHEHIIDGKNGYIVNMNLSNLNVDKILNKIPTDFTYIEKSNEQDWLGKISNLDIPEEKIDSKTVKIKVIQDFNDNLLNKYITRLDNLILEYKNKGIDLTRERIDHLVGLSLIKEE
jgi:hypothetical protein